SSAGALVFGYNNQGVPKAIFSLSSNPAVVGGGVNDLVTVSGDFNGNFVGQIKINPLAPLSTNSPYTILTYRGMKDGNFNGTIGVVDALQPSRYTFSADYSTAHTVKLNVLTAAGNLVWNNNATTGIWSTNSADANWFNGVASDQFDQLDSVTFN